MSISDSAQRCNELRIDLKAWEKKFAAANQGRKAGRSDIKAEETIAQKYKEYNRLREALSGKGEPQTPSKRTSTRNLAHDADRTPKAAEARARVQPKRNSEESSIHINSPLKRKRSEPNIHMRTPMKTELEKASTTAETGASPQYLSPAFIGPTPQRDGKVLGLFDLLPPSLGTPSKSRIAFADVKPNTLRTPQKTPSKANIEITPQTTRKWERTPMSSGRRFMLDQIVTPPKITNDTTSPRTPAFLRRDAYLAPIDEDHEPTPRVLPWQRKGLFKSMAAAFNARKQVEEEKYDEEADIMREMEMEEMGIPAKKKQKQTLSEKLSLVLVGDSQSAMPLGPDRGLESDDEEDEEEEQLGPDGQPRRVWKKKGLKRQTRRNNMKPHFLKPGLPAPQVQDATSEEENNEVPETQVDAENNSKDTDSDGSSSYASDASHTPKRAKTLKKVVNSASQPKNTTSTTDSVDKTKEGAVKKAARKIKATAHANYQRLKIKSKGGNGGKGRFGKRR